METDMLRLYNLLVDHKEPYDLIEKGGRAGEAHFWLMPPIKELVGEHLASPEREPPIPLGTPAPLRTGEVKLIWRANFRK